MRGDGFGQILPTPPVLANRSLPTTDLLPPPAGNRFSGTVNPVPADVLARSSWQADCPVSAGELSYLTLSFWGFDGRAHTGEITVFGQLFAAARGQTNWSAHAYGLAIDVDPFCNPYTKGDLVLPELASAYLDRGNRRPGMITAGDRTVAAFSAIGWTWGGTWTTPTDRMHFSADGR
ncbi:M15 family metallopeptidase [Amycolatopsis coloradensis]|uniref:M15 family metallopeptidase n=1 Tax=Amycolatopsis coloradensis TaxID=76021 RepID=UPI003CC91AB7